MPITPRGFSAIAELLVVVRCNCDVLVCYTVAIVAAGAT